MTCQVLLFALTLGAIQGAFADLPRNCSKLYHVRSTLCCKIRYAAPKSFDDIKECFDIHKADINNFLDDNDSKEHKHHNSCEVDKCIAEKRGILTEDGTVDEDALKKQIELDFEQSPQIVGKLIDNCSEKSQFVKYGPDYVCDLIKLKHCLTYQLTTECTDWFDTTHCSHVKELVDECKID